MGILPRRNVLKKRYARRDMLSRWNVLKKAENFDFVQRYSAISVAKELRPSKD